MPAQLDSAVVAPLEGAAPVEEVTTLPRAALAVHPLEADAGVRVNQSAAALLALEHRVVHRQDRRAEPPAVETPRSPEEKLLLAIFGEGVQLALPYQDENGVAELGAVIPHGTAVLYDHQTRARVLFTAEQSGEVVDVARTTEGLPEGVAERVAVTVRAAGPLAPGDVLWEGDRRVGLLEAVVDDGDAEPRIYLGRAERARVTGPTAHVSRRLPTASQQVRGRAIGEYDLDTQQPATGEALRPGQQRALAERGCLALFNDFAAYKCDQVHARTRAYEALARSEAPGDPVWGPPAANPQAPPDAAVAPQAAPDPFAFFTLPSTNEPSREALCRAVALARACGLTLALEGHGLALGVLADPSEGSRGEVAPGELFSQRVFGPTRDYQCACGALARMKHRGAVCATCGVEVLNSSVRRARFGHIALPAPVTHRWLATRWRAVPVLPAGLRAEPGAPLNALYARVLAERSQAAVDALLEQLFAQLRELLADPAAPRVDYSGRALALLDPAVPAGRCVAPAPLLAEIARPLLYAMCEEFGYATTLKSSKKLMDRDAALRRAFVARAFATRPVLLGSDDAARGDALAAAAADAGDDPVVRLGPDLAARLGVASGDFVVVHLPLSEGAVREAYWLAGAGPTEALRDLATDLRGEGSWLRELAQAPPDAFAARLAEAARARRVDPCTWPPAAFLIGGYAIRDAAGLPDPPAPPAFEPPQTGAAAAAATPPGAPAELLDRSVEELELSVRTANGLAAAQIRTVRELVQKTEADVLRIKQFGRQSLKEIKELLAELGLSLGMRL